MGRALFWVCVFVMKRCDLYLGRTKKEVPPLSLINSLWKSRVDEIAFGFSNAGLFHPTYEAI
jgi:hypothetical protein